MRFDFVCAENVQHFHAADFQVIRDQRAMATPPDRFRTHDRSRAAFLSNVEQALYSFLELLRFHVIGVPAERCVAPRTVSRVWLGFSFAAQLRKMFVTDFVRGQRFRQRLFIELRVALRARPRAHVEQQFDLVFLQQRNEFVERSCRVSDGPDSHDSTKGRPGVFANLGCRAGAPPADDSATDAVALQLNNAHNLCVNEF